jgi:ribulose-phosphate 3-epimerase
MIVRPERYIEAFKDAGAEWLTVHFEACTHLHRNLQVIKQHGMKAGVSLNPHTPVNMLQDIIREVDLVLLMSVNPGFGGQSFIPQTLEKVRELKRMIQNSGSNALIEVDGGVNAITGGHLVEAGVDALVAGSYIFKSTDPSQNIRILKNL